TRDDGQGSTILFSGQDDLLPTQSSHFAVFKGKKTVGLDTKTKWQRLGNYLIPRRFELVQYKPQNNGQVLPLSTCIDFDNANAGDAVPRSDLAPDGFPVPEGS